MVAWLARVGRERIEETIDPEQAGPAPFMRDTWSAAHSLVELSVPIRRRYAADHALCGKVPMASPRSVDKELVARSIPPSEPFDTYNEIHVQRRRWTRTEEISDAERTWIVDVNFLSVMCVKNIFFSGNIVLYVIRYIQRCEL